MSATLAPLPAGNVRPGSIPTLSVIVAAYQAAHVVGNAVRSALDQVPPPLEVVVCDDGSTDDVAGALAALDGPVRLIRIEHGGEAAAKNSAARAAVGDFVVILDADDLFLPGRLQAISRLAAARPDLDLITTDAYLEAEGEVVGRCYHAGHRFVIADQRREILERNFVFGLAAVRRARLLEIGGFDESISHNTDWECWIRLILAGGGAGLIDAPLAVYRVHEHSMSADRLAMYRGRVETLQKTARHPGLGSEERRSVERRLAEERRRVRREELQAALAEREPGSRQRALEVARDPEQGRRTRIKALAAYVAPALLGALIRRRRASTWTGVGELRFRRR